jgi:hypothetical protein
MREIWMLTAAAWREASDCRAPNRADDNQKFSPVIDSAGAFVVVMRKSL